MVDVGLNEVMPWIQALFVLPAETLFAKEAKE